MSITPLPPAENSQGGFKTWVSSQRKFLALTGQFSVALNSLEPYPNIRAWLGRIEALPGFAPMPATKIGLAA